MEELLVPRAVAAATSLAGDLSLLVDDAIVLQNSNNLALRLLPCDVFARVALLGHEIFAFEVDLAQRLTAAASPVAMLEPRVEPAVFERGGFAVTFWTYYEMTPDQYSSADHADVLHRLHQGMRDVEIAAPHFMERVAEAELLVTNEHETPALAVDDRNLLLDTLRNAGQQISGRGAAEQLLHGEPHAGNLLSTQEGLVFIDLETFCRGPIEFDVAHMPDEVATHYPGVDGTLLQECRQLVLAMVAAWRWDIGDDFPNGTQHGRDILTLLREGPPWPALGALGASCREDLTCRPEVEYDHP